MPKRGLRETTVTCLSLRALKTFIEKVDEDYIPQLRKFAAEAEVHQYSVQPISTRSFFPFACVWRGLVALC